MSFLKKYVDYLKDNPEGYWFKRKAFGWGWTPATWQGWGVTILFVFLIIGNALRLELDGVQGAEAAGYFILQTAGLVFLLIAICWRKGESPKWQWGLPDKSEEDGNL